MLIEALINHCSPILARLKTGGMVSLPLKDLGQIMTEMEQLNSIFQPKGLTLTLLWQGNGKVLVYLYRVRHLEGILADERIQAFLKECGYISFDLEESLATLRQRMQNSNGFPHEVGVFLGYPLEDVLGFIMNEGRNCVCSGCWKAYTNECEALQTFQRLRKCRAVYSKLFASGYPLDRLVVRTQCA